MQIRHLGHAALEIHLADQHLLVDPGNLAHPGVADVTGLHAILITHQHPDHADPERLGRLAAANPGAQLITEPQLAAQISEDPQFAAVREAGMAPQALTAGEGLELGGVHVRAVGGQHAIIHPDIPRVGNTGFVLEAEGEQTLGITGDSLEQVPEFARIDVLAFALTAPWSKLQETIDFLRGVQPRVALPVHDAVASPAGRGLYMKQTSAFSGDDVEVRDWPEDGTALTL